MKTLFLYKILHHPSDLTSEMLIAIRKDVGARQFKQLHQKSDLFWNGLEKEIEKKWFKYARVRIYQDGWPGIKLYKQKMKEVISDKEAMLKIVTKIAGSGSRNYKLLKKLLRKGATLENSENYKLLIEERNFILKIKEAKSEKERAAAKKKYETQKASLLAGRDKYFANRINKTLQKGEIGLAFIGRQHNISPYLHKDIQVHRGE